MTKLSKSEKKLLKILNILRTAFIVMSALGFFVMLWVTCAYDSPKYDFGQCCVHMILGLTILGFSILFYNYTTNVHDDYCEIFGLYDEISYVKEAKEFDDDAYEEYMIAFTGESPFKPDEPETPKVIQIPTRKPISLHDIDLRKMAKNQTATPHSNRQLEIPIIRHEKMSYGVTETE